MDTTHKLLPISFLTIGTFLSLSLALLLPDSLPYIPLLLLLTLGAAQDLHSQKINDFITLGGTICGWGLAFFLSSPGIKSAFFGTIFCGGIGIIITLLGKLLFGKSHLVFDPPELIEINPKEKSITFQGETNPWENLFSQGNGSAHFISLPEGENPFSLQITPKALQINGVPSLKPFSGEISEISLPRDTMGWGDSKTLALIGSFLGIQGGLFTLFTGAILGALIGKFIQNTQGRIPFVPFLWAGAFLFVWQGSEILQKLGWK